MTSLQVSAPITVPEGVKHLDNHNLENLTNGKAPSSRLTDPVKAQELGHKLVKDGKTRSNKNATIKGQIDGNRPYNQGKLKATGQAWRTNVNWREAKAAASAALTPFYDLFTGGKFLMEITTKFGNNVKEQDDFSKAITEEVDYHVKDEWNGFDFNMQAMLFEVVTYGKGFLVHLDPSDWRFEWVQQCYIYAPDRSKANTSKLPVLVMRRDYQIHELWKLITNDKAGDAGWNVEACKRAIEAAYPKNTNDNSSQDYEAIQQRIKDNDLFEGMSAAVIPVFDILVAEFSGKVTRLIVPEDKLPSRDGTKSQSVEFLYQAVGEHGSMAEVISPFFFETLDGSWNGATGLGDELFHALEIKNRLNCTTVDSGFLGSSIILQAQDANSVDKASLIQIGPFSIIPPGFAVQQSTVMGNLQGPMLVKRDIDNIIAQNTGIYRPRMDKPEGNPRTAKEVEINYQQGATLSSSAVNRFYLNLDQFYKELVRRLVKDPAFKKRCEDRGIPQQALDKICRVRAYRSVGNGSAFMRQQAQSRVAPLVPLMPEAGRIEWARDTVASEMNQYAAMRYFPDTQDDVLKTDHAYDATIENAVLKMGAPVLWTPKQNNVIHAQTHLQFSSAAAASLQQGGNPIEVLNTIDRIGAHVEVHLQHIEANKYQGDEAKALRAQQKQLAGIADQLRAKIKEEAQAAAERNQQQQQAAAIQQGIDPATQIAAAKAANEMKIKNAKAAQDMQIKGAKAAQKLQQTAQGHNQKLAISDASAAASIAQQQAKTEAQTETAEK